LNVAVGADIGLTVGDAIFLGGTFTLTTQSAVHVTDGTIDLAAADVLDLQITGGHLFAGVGGSRTGKTVTAGSGLDASGVAARIVTVKQGTGASYTALDLLVAAASLTGLGSAFSFDIANAFLRVNSVTPAGTKLDWSNVSPAGLKFAQIDASLNVAVGADIGLTVGDAIFLGGTFTLTTQSAVHVTDGTIDLAAADVLDLQITGGHLFAGVGGSRTGKTVTAGSGLDASGVAARIVTVKQGTGASYTALDLLVASASLTGLGSAFSFDIANAFLRVNSVTPAGPKLDWSNVSPAGLKFAQIDASLNVAVGADIGLTVGDAIFLGGTFTLTTQSAVHVTDGTIDLAAADVLDLQITGGHLFAGVGGSRTGKTVTAGSGLDASGVAARIVTVKQGTGASYTALDLLVAAASLTGLGSAFSFDIANAFLRVNSVTPAGPKLDWSNVSPAGLKFAQIDASLNVAVGADIGLTVGDAIFLGGTFTLTTQSAVHVTDGTIDLAAADVLDLQITGGHLFAGVGGSRTGKTVTA